MELPDHRRLGRQLGIYAPDDRCGAGLPLWLPAGTAVREQIERYVVDLEKAHGYQHVRTPELAKRTLYERTGHWDHYRGDMYPPMPVGAEDAVLRPMLCPHHILVFEALRPSLRELPLRLAELGTMFRRERSGVVGGLSRVRQMTLNDGHVFCREDQVGDEVARILGMVGEAYAALAIPQPHYRLSRHDAGSKYAADAGLWERSEALLRDALEGLGLPYEEAPGEAAFYGPKIDLQVTDPAGREETLSTVQVDFLLPERLDLWVGEGSERIRPVMVHRSIVSTMERMVAHLLEVHAGALPVWLAPVQVRVLPVVDDAGDQARAVAQAVRARGGRSAVDDRRATLDARIRDAQQAKVPYIAVVGRREQADGTVAVRLRDGRRLPAMAPAALAELVQAVAGARGGDLLPGDG
jgi:threonyl-tRNA synthetase